MSDDLVERLRGDWFGYEVSLKAIDAMDEAAGRIEALTVERYEAINQLDSAIHSQIVLEKRTAAVMEDRKLILEERDRTFALMLARAEKAEAERDKAYANGYSDAETEISKSALGQRNAFLHSQYANAADHIKSLTAKLADAMEGLEKCQAELDEYSRQEYPLDHTVHERYRQRDYDANPARITLAALKGESRE